MIRKLSTIYKAKRAMILFSSMGLTFITFPPMKDMVSFSFSFSKTGKKFIPRFIPFSNFLTVAQNHSQSDKSRPSASILVLFPKFDTARHLHVSVCVFLKNVSSLKKNPWRKHGNYLTSTAARAPSAPLMFPFCVWGYRFGAPHVLLSGGAVAPLPPRPARHYPFTHPEMNP